MTTELVPSDQAIAAPNPEQAAGALAHILATGDLSELSNEQRCAYYLDLCASLGLNPRSRPFDWLTLDGRLVFYPNKSAAEQLRRVHQISVKVTRREPVGELFVVEVEGTTPSGRSDQASKYVPISVWDRQSGQRQRLVGEKLANAYAKAETGAKRRLVLSMVGLAGLPDQDEMTHGRPVIVDGAGRIITEPTEEQRYLAATPAAAAAIGEPTYERTAAGTAGPLHGTADQRPTADELQPPVRPAAPPPTFKPSDQDIEHWQRTYFGAVTGTSLHGDDGRHAFVQQWTDGRTRSLRNFLASATERQATELIEHARMLAEEERTAIALSQAEADADADADETEF